ncbi:MAG: peptide chain release factor 2, partial [Ruthenibacterium sp.]
MVILDDIKRQLGELAPVVTDLADALAIHQCRMRLDELENKSADPAFYNDPSASGA